MSDRWQRLSLEEFFSHANWQGVVGQQISLPSEIQSKSLSSWQGWTVEEFFRSANWQGKALTNETIQTNSITFSLTLPVEQLFRCFVWEEKLTIAPLPEKQEIAKQKSDFTQQINLTNLTDLF
jgi:hypothetical protein